MAKNKEKKNKKQGNNAEKHKPVNNDKSYTGKFLKKYLE